MTLMQPPRMQPPRMQPPRMQPPLILQTKVLTLRLQTKHGTRCVVMSMPCGSPDLLGSRCGYRREKGATQGYALWIARAAMLYPGLLFLMSHVQSMAKQRPKTQAGYSVCPRREYCNPTPRWAKRRLEHHMGNMLQHGLKASMWTQGLGLRPRSRDPQ